MMNDEPQLEILGKKVGIPQSPEEAVLETFDNKHPDNLYLVPFVQPRDEFTSLCPVTGQPDVASVEIIYVPVIKMIESKALKLYLNSFRNTGEFHEDVANRILNDLVEALEPKYMRVYMDFAPRGSLAIKPLVEYWNVGPKERERIEWLVKSWDRKV